MIIAAEHPKGKHAPTTCLPAQEDGGARLLVRFHVVILIIYIVKRSLVGSVTITRIFLLQDGT